ncbi:helix-turn-helix domain-containing protein [Kineococcus rhizosphaerae]|uniref:XRE family transcriptional regulator n=1 Tax=Kineococcus rhizosphaerae TaxID=559628 RepID=A0A2T0R3K3_9ACTN|nr:XRE family transcriptional regulator [Kineococcus rhizosphaerae]PRY14626.1 XRE family transcriptional regulator [Kineococcus rhizosphaerae]
MTHPVPAAGPEGSPAIGGRLRAARTARRMSIEEVATAAGVTKGFLSRLERDRAGVSVAALVRICGVLDLAVGSLFEPAPAGEVLRAADYPPISFGGHGLREFLLTPRGEQRLATILSEIEPGGGGGAEAYALPADVEFCLVLAGGVELTFPGGPAPVVLEAGDALTFDPGEPHTFTAGPDGARVLWVIAPGLLAARSSDAQVVLVRDEDA